MSDSPRILIFTDWYLPGFKAGGPIRSIANLVKLLGSQAWVITGDRDLGDHRAYPGMPLNQWIAQDNGAHVMYVSPDKIGNGAIKKVCSDFLHDTWYMNSMFSLRFTLQPVIWNRRWSASNKLILAPRGMLHPEALRIKAWKKKLFLKIMRFFGVFDRVHWHATGEEESIYIQQHFGYSSQVQVMENIPTLHPFREAVPDFSHLKMVLISRLSEEKGVLEGLRSWFELQELKKVRLHIIGPHGDAPYTQRVLELIQFHADWNVSYLGPLTPAQCLEELSQSHFLFSPTRGENYGHAIAEALFMGVPVVVTNNTPWRGLQEKQWGWNYGTDDQDFNQVMLQVLALKQEDYRRLLISLRANRASEELKWQRDILRSFLFEKH